MKVDHMSEDKKDLPAPDAGVAADTRGEDVLLSDDIADTVDLEDGAEEAPTSKFENDGPSTINMEDDIEIDDAVSDEANPNGEESPAAEAVDDELIYDDSTPAQSTDGEPSYALLHGVSIDAITETILARQRTLGGARHFEQQAMTQFGGYDNVLLNSAQIPSEASLSQERIRKAIASGSFDTVLRDPESGKVLLGLLTAASQKASDQPRILSGRAGLNAYRQRAKRGVVRRIPLYNSGFYIELTSPSPSMTNNFMEQADNEAGTLGRSYGAAFYLHMDHFIKEAAARLFRGLVIDSTLMNWDKGNTLLERIKLEDYDVILMSIAAMMYPDGFKGYRHACTNVGKCDHVHHADVDLLKMIRNNYDKLSKDAVAHMRKAAMGTVTIAEVEAYQAMIPLIEPASVDKSDQNVLRWGLIGLVMKSPSYYEFISSGKRFLDLINDGIQRMDEDSLSRHILYHMIRQFAPWISEIRIYLDEESDKVTDIIRDPNAIEDILDELQSEDNDNALLDKLANIVESHKISHICYPVEACGKCGHIPDTPSGFFTVDVMETFFTMCGRKLARRD